MLLTFGESNGAGLALNTWLTATEAATRPGVQILNNSNFSFENLLIGTNNNIDCNLPDMTTHGIENELANSVARNEWPYSSIYLVKTAQAQARIADWSDPGTYWTKFKNRIDNAYSAQPSLKISIYWTLGLNDLKAGLTPALWKSGTLTLITQVRNYLDSKVAGLGTNAIIYMPHFMAVVGYSDYANYNTKMDEIASASSGGVVAMGSTDAPQVAGSAGDLHWGYYGNKVLCRRFASGVLGTSYPERVYSLTNTTWGSPNPITNCSQSTVYLLISSATTAGAVAASTLAGAAAYGVQFYWPATGGANGADIDINFDSENGSNFNWNSGNTWLVGVFTDGDRLYSGADGSTANSMSLPFGATQPIANYPIWGRLLVFDNDAMVLFSSDSGGSWCESSASSGPVNPGAGVLVGVSPIYVRAVFASPASSQKMQVDWVK